jgi:hypothetical protein
MSNRIILPKKPQTTKSCELQDLLFPVKNVVISEKFPLIQTLDSVSNAIFGTIKGKETLLYTGSKVYELIPNQEIFPVIEDILKNAGIEFQAHYSMFDHSRFFAEYTIKAGGVAVGDSNDLIYPLLIVDHSYNGRVKYKITFGYFRKLCTNGLSVPVEGKEKVNFSVVGKHTSQVKESLKTLMEKVNTFVVNQEKYAERFNIIAERKIENFTDRVLAVIEATGIGKRGFEQITETIKKESAQLQTPVNDWLIYNGFNFHIFNARTKEGKEYGTSLDLRRQDDEKVLMTILDKPELTAPKDRAKLEKLMKKAEVETAEAE